MEPEPFSVYTLASHTTCLSFVPLDIFFFFLSLISQKPLVGYLCQFCGYDPGFLIFSMIRSDNSLLRGLRIPGFYPQDASSDPYTHPVVTTKYVSRHCPVSLGTKTVLIKNHRCSLISVLIAENGPGAPRVEQLQTGTHGNTLCPSRKPPSSSEAAATC